MTKTPSPPPTYRLSPSKPKLKLPPGACDAHVHVMGPAIVAVIAFGKRLADIVWHLQIHMDASLIAQPTPSEAARQPLLVDNPQRFYKFAPARKLTAGAPS